MKEAVKTHSIIGIVSCVIGIGMFVLFLMATLAFYFQFKSQRGPNSEGLAVLQLVIEMILPIPVHLAGLILGVAALFFPNRKKLFPILGVVLNLIFGLSGLFPWLWLIIGGLGRV